MNEQRSTGKEFFLSIETATAVSSVAIFKGRELISLEEISEGNAHSKLITVMIGNALKEAGISASELSAVGVSQGPGSYTGLRVGVSAGKGLCMALDIPLISFGSLESLAQLTMTFAKEHSARIISMIDARRMEVFAQEFNSDRKPMSEPKAVIVDENSFSESLNSGKVIFVGDGAAKCKALLEKNSNAIVMETILSSSKGGGTLIHEKFLLAEFEDLVSFVPFYLKDYVVTAEKKKIL